MGGAPRTPLLRVGLKNFMLNVCKMFVACKEFQKTSG